MHAGDDLDLSGRDASGAGAEFGCLLGLQGGVMAVLPVRDSYVGVEGHDDFVRPLSAQCIQPGGVAHDGGIALTPQTCPNTLGPLGGPARRGSGHIHRKVAPWAVVQRLSSNGKCVIHRALFTYSDMRIIYGGPRVDDRAGLVSRNTNHDIIRKRCVVWCFSGSQRRGRG